MRLSTKPFPPITVGRPCVWGGGGGGTRDGGSVFTCQHAATVSGCVWCNKASNFRRSRSGLLCTCCHHMSLTSEGGRTRTCVHLLCRRRSQSSRLIWRRRCHRHGCHIYQARDGACSVRMRGTRTPSKKAGARNRPTPAKKNIAISNAQPFYHHRHHPNAQSPPPPPSPPRFAQKGSTKRALLTLTPPRRTQGPVAHCLSEGASGRWDLGQQRCF
jgi:hypothetical protein